MTDHDHAADRPADQSPGDQRAADQRAADQRIADRIRAAYADENPASDLAAVLDRAATIAASQPHQAPTRRVVGVGHLLTRLLRRRRPDPDPEARTAPSPPALRHSGQGGSQNPTL